MSAALREFADAAALAAALADAVAEALAGRIAADGAAVLAVSGGTTPCLFFRVLSKRVLDWGRVTVILADDRWVVESSSRSNAALVRRELLQNAAARARFLPLVNDHATPEAGLFEIESKLADLPPLACAVLGMGTDGHVAGMFPGGDRLAQAMAPAAGQHVEGLRAEQAGEPRITLTLPVLLAADYLALHIEGQTKRRVLEAALTPGSAAEMPVRAILARPNLQIFWSA